MSAFSSHSSALQEHILMGLQASTPQEQALFAKFVRVLNQGLQATAISIGADDELSHEEKGQFITLVALLNTAITSAFAVDQVSNTHSLQHTTLER